jgi:rubrerythrin
MPKYAILVPMLLLGAGCASSPTRVGQSPPPPGGCAAMAGTGQGACPTGAAVAAPAAAELSDATRDALLAALADERRARAFYLAVLERHGRVMPFANIVNAEARHAQLVADLLTARGCEAPADTATFPASEVPDTIAACCDAAAQAEIDNMALYDELLPTLNDDGVRQVFLQLQWASRERHLPAFQRFASRE